jgi:ribulose 1,5-bisphosphate carboxylase large subunit-like protein
VLSFPFENVGANLPTLVTTVAGNLFELRELSAVRLLGLDLPAAFVRAYSGPQFGIAGTRRLAGVDHLHVNGLRNKFWGPDDSVVASIQACLTPMFGGYQAMPVLSSGQTVLQAPETYSRSGTIDLMYLAGGGIMAHPAAPAAGVYALRQAWEAAVARVPLDDYAAGHPALAQAMATFGGRARPAAPPAAPA